MALLALLNVTCQGAVSPTEALTSSGEKFDQLTSFQALIESTSEAGGLTFTSKGSAAYVDDKLAYMQLTMTAEGAGISRESQSLIVPPDLYTQMPDGQWYVLSPWHQGTRPNEVPDLSLNEASLDYHEITRKLDDVEQLADETVDGVKYMRFAGKLPFDTIDLEVEVPDSIEGSLDVELWVDSGTELPYRVLEKGELKAGELEFSLKAETVFEYNRLVVVPEVPHETRPYRDLQFPEAPCTGSEFLECLSAQAALEPMSKPTCGGEGRRVCLAPLGQIDPTLVQQLVEHYREQYGIEVTVLTPLAVPADAADSKRQQADAWMLVDYAGAHFEAAYDDPETVFIGITPLDLYNSESHFRYVFGVKGDHGYPKAIVSSFRMNPEFYGEQTNTALTLTRFRKLLTKYIGILYYGLPVSDDPTSPMFSNILGPDDLDIMREPLIIPETQ
jgi:predicted Zn-dependent protease